MERIKRRNVSWAEEDWISQLPEHLIDSILERLPIEDAVRTSILSKIWRHRWTTMRALVFDPKFSRKFAKNGAFGRNGFIRIINKVLILHKGPILKFALYIPNVFLDSFQEVDQFMLLLSRNSLTELIIINTNQRYELPSCVFSCLELRSLKTTNGFFNPPREFEGFLNLEELSLKHIDFGDRLCGTRINLPRLKTLTLNTCTNVYNFNIKATKLQNLFVIACPDAMLLRLLESRCLFQVWIAFEKPIQDFVGVEKMTLAKMLSNFPRVRQFYIDSYFLKFFIAEKIPKLLPHTIYSLKQLRLFHYQLADLHQLHGALCLLRNSPNLETLHIFMAMETWVDVGAASNHLESPNCLDCTLEQLQTVEMTYLEGSKPELLFIKLILAHSPSLQKFTITPSKASDVQKRLDIAMDIMQFPRASTKAKMFYLNPKP
ncbi:unnamed protein product [Lactuca saligna]|uniref:F-box domain-containing protein n=1 Tax=Lactuca saligna TaxID=75948 RepID=A0AA35VHJ6_LACSI|nr:unnamed protein product [Lactuca saligna]